MARFNALTTTLEAPVETARKPARKKAPAKAVPAKGEPAKTSATENAARVPQSPASPLATLAGRVPVATFALLLKTDDLSKATATRTQFAAWCAARPELMPIDWRAAWTLYKAATPKPTPAPTPAPARPAPTPSAARAWLDTL